MPSGKYSSTETKQKMSLYLLSQLFYGIVLLHNLQTTAYLDNLQGFAKSLLRVSAPESRAKR
jgi:N terminus of Rad21 / Rec8 like protein